VPYALWQRGDIWSRSSTKPGDVITDEVDGRYANLLLVVNHGAQRRAVEINKALESVPELRPRVRAAFLISDRRWDLQLGKRHFDPLAGGQYSMPRWRIWSEWTRKSGLLSRDIVAIDMRLADRVTVRLSDEAAEERKIMTGGKGRVRTQGSGTHEPLREPSLFAEDAARCRAGGPSSCRCSTLVRPRSAA
jgi:cell division protein FtsQ